MKRVYSYFSLLLVFAVPCLGMELTTINPIIEQAIKEAPNVYIGAGIYNEMVKRNHVNPTVANTRWCVDILSNKLDAYKDKFAAAQHIESSHSQKWLVDYLSVAFQFAHARNRLDQAIRKNDIPLASFLLSSKSPELSNSEIHNDGWQISFAYLTAKYNRKEILQCLIDSGSDIKRYAQTDSRLAPIHIAAWHGNYECLQLLLESGVHPNFPCGLGKSPLYHLCRASCFGSEHLKCAFLLLDHGAQNDIIPTNDLLRYQIILNLKKILEHYYTRKKLA